MYFTTDYQRFQEHMAHARVFELTGEPQKAINELKKALSLVKGKPFEKIYDNYAEDTRTRILIEIDRSRQKL